MCRWNNIIFIDYVSFIWFDDRFKIDLCWFCYIFGMILRIRGIVVDGSWCFYLLILRNWIGVVE